jgi:hypothetical protein
VRLGVAGLGLATVLAVLAIAGCGPTPPTGVPVSTPGGTPAGPPVDAPTPATAPPSGDPPTSASANTPVRDDSLLAILPPEIDGVPVVAEEASFDEAASDPAFAQHVTRAAFAVAAGTEDLASGVIAELVPGVVDAGFFRDWRDTYNEGACGQAGGVAGNAEAELGGRTVHIATCGGGLRVYHAWVEERGVLVSLFSLGEARFGERLMAALRP